MTAARPPAVVVGAGVKAPGGCTPDELWASLCAGRSTAERFHDDRLPPETGILVSRVEGFDPTAYLSPADARRFDRAHQLAVGAAQDAMDAVGSALPPPERCAVVCGVGQWPTALYETQHENLLGRGLGALNPLTAAMSMPSSPAAILALRFGFRGPCLTLSTACASGASAIGEGLELLRRGGADLVLAGGVDSMVTYATLCGFHRLGAMSSNVAEPAVASRPFDADRDGFVMGEGAGFVVLARVETALAAGWPVLGTVAGYGATCDAHHLVAPSPDGEGALRCMRMALTDAGLARADIVHVNAHGTSTVLNDRAEATAVTDLFGPGNPPVTSVKGTTGHLVGGSGAVEVVVAMRSLREGVVPPVAGLRTLDASMSVDVVVGVPRHIPAGFALSNSFGFGGNNAVLVIGPPGTVAGAVTDARTSDR